jgi:hypothetical protein
MPEAAMVRTTPARAAHRALILSVVFSALGFAAVSPVPAAAAPRLIVSGTAADLAVDRNAVGPAQYRRRPYRRYYARPYYGRPYYGSRCDAPRPYYAPRRYYAPRYYGRPYRPDYGPRYYRR